MKSQICAKYAYLAHNEASSSVYLLILNQKSLQAPQFLKGLNLLIMVLTNRVQGVLSHIWGGETDRAVTEKLGTLTSALNHTPIGSHTEGGIQMMHPNISLGVCEGKLIQ